MDPTYTLKPQLRIKITNIYLDETVTLIPGACPGICKGGAQNLKAFFFSSFFAFQFFRGGGAQLRK